MKLQTTTVTGCGSGSCLCAGTAVSPAAAAINGVALHHAAQRPDKTTLLERARAELLRQQAVNLGLLPRHTGLTAPELTEQDWQVIHAMIDREVVMPRPDEEACEHYFEAHRNLYVQGQALHVRHILFLVTPDVNVHALLVQAEGALLELSRPGVRSDRFAQLAAELSGCPTGAVGGDLGWIGPDDCDPELANELFHHKHSRWGMGVHPRLIHTRHGFHILEVLGRRKGRPSLYPEVRERVANELTASHREASLRQYLAELVRHATVEGIDLDGMGLEGAVSPVFQ
jgi:peptidyl-prolyl cis-trans isomerase C